MRWRRLLVAVVAAAAGLGTLGAPARVDAHAGLESSSPAAGSVLAESPERIVLDFDEGVEASTAAIELYDEAGSRIDLGEPAADTGDGTVIAADVPGLDDGTFAVVWRVSSVDGHVIDGAFSFQVGEGAGADGAALVDRVSGGLQSPGEVRDLYGIGRGFAYLGFAILVGGVLLALLAGAGIDGRLVGLLRAGWLLGVVGVVVTVASYGATLRGGGLGDVVAPSTWSEVGDTATGRWLLLRLGAALAAGALVIAVSSARTGWWRAGALVVGVAVVLTYPMAGHAAATGAVPLWALVGGLHTAAAFTWIGGLVALVVERARWLDDDRQVADRFSPMAAVAVPVIVATGTAQTLELVGDLGDLTSTGWGRVLLVKVVLVLVLVALGGVSRALLRHDGPRALRRTVAAEAAVGVVVLGLAAGLVALPPEAAPESRVFEVSLTEAGLIADVTVTPGQVGSNEVHVILVPPGGNLQPVTGLTARMDHEERGVSNLAVEVETTGTNHFTGTMSLPFPGEWTLELVVEVSPGSTVLLSTTVPIP